MSGWRVALAAAVTIWLAGWVPSIIYSWRVWGGPQFYAIWIILGPMVLCIAACAAVGLFMFYGWALARPNRRDLQQRIADLEQELGMQEGQR